VELVRRFAHGLTDAQFGVDDDRGGIGGSAIEHELHTRAVAQLEGNLDAVGRGTTGNEQQQSREHVSACRHGVTSLCPIVVPRPHRPVTMR
jgi:hypothetical protein